MDEPTATLDGNDLTQPLDLVRSPRDQGVAIVIISHRPGETTEIADRIAILRDDQTIDITDMKDPVSTQGKVIPLVVGRNPTQRYPECNVETDEEVFRVEDWIVYHLIQAGCVVIFEASFNVRHGEVVGIAGLIGAGRTELAMSVFDRSSGTRISDKFFKDGKEITIKSVSDVVEHGITYTTEDHKQYSLSLIDNIRHNVAAIGLFRLSRRDLVNGHKKLATAADYKERVNIRSNSVLQKTGFLSGGNQQKVILSKWLYTDADVLILDGPARGIGVDAKLEIYTLINKMVEEGKAVIIISSKLEEILDVSDRIYTLMCDHITSEVKAEDATQGNFIELMIIESAREEQK